MPFADDAITIDRLHLRGEEHSARETVRAIQTAHLPDTGRRWYLMRQVVLKTRPETIAQQLGKSVDQLVWQAVHGSQPNAHQADAVFFDSLAELLKQLSLDIHRGQSSHWYWQPWLAERDAAPAAHLSQLWCQYPLHLPELSLFLARQGALVQVWQEFSRDQILTINLAYCQSLGLDPRPFLKPGRTSATPSHNHQPQSVGGQPPGPAAEASDPFALIQLMGDLPAPLRQSWEKIATEQDIQTEGNSVSPSISLALLLSVTSWQPTHLPRWQKRWPAVVEQWRRLCLSAPSSPPQQSAQTRHPRTPPPWPNQPGEADRIDNIGRVTTAVTASPPGTATPRRSDTYPIPAKSPVTDKTAEPLCAITTQHGGLFLLINPIARFLQQQPEYPSILHQAHGGWALLWQLGQLLESETEETFSRDVGLERLFSRLQGDERPPMRFSSIDLGTLPETIAKTLASHPRLATLCSSELLRRNAQIMFDCNHLDIYFSSQSIDLESRIAGLDINPGWVDWLGRVVNFHYRDEEARHGHD